MKYQVFISYRRATGELLAHLLYERLSGEGYPIFFDVETMQSGKFNTQIYKVIEESDDFLLVLSENALDRCTNPNDWVRLEIEYALKMGKNIIPIFGKNFSFPENVPSSIEQVKLYHGVSVSSEFFDASIERIKRLMVSSPTNAYKAEPTKNQKFLELLTSMVQAIDAYKKALKKGDQQNIYQVSGVLQKSVEQIYLFYVHNQFSDKDNAEKAKKIIDLYNLFIDYFGKFVSYPLEERQTSISAKEYAEKAEKTFDLLNNLIVKYIVEAIQE